SLRSCWRFYQVHDLRNGVARPCLTGLWASGGCHVRSRHDDFQTPGRCGCRLRSLRSLRLCAPSGRSAASAPCPPSPPLCLTSLVRNCGDTEPQVAVPERRRVPAAVRRPAAPAVAAPAAAPDHPVRAISRSTRIDRLAVFVFAVAVGAPLPDVAVYVAQAE